MNLDVAAYRSHFPALEFSVSGKRMVYLDSACTALKPRCVAERVSDFYLHWGGCGGKRSIHLASQQVEEWVSSARRAAAEFIGAESPEEIVFTSGTTEAANLLAWGFPYEKGRDEVVVTEAEHNGVLLPFCEAAKAGKIKLRLAPVSEKGMDLEAMTRLIGDKTALVAMTRASNVLGGVFPADEVIRAAHRVGARVFLDDAQFLSSHREDVAVSNADFVAFSAHKLGGPFGTGVLYGRGHLLNSLGRHKVGGGTVKTVRAGEGYPDARYLDAPMGFEAGVPNLSGIVGFGEALRFLSAWPAPAARAHIEALVRRAYRGLARFPQLRVLGTEASLAQGSLVSFYPVHEGFSATDFNLYLNHELKDRFIAIRAGEHCAHILHERLGVPATARLSFAAYNTPEEVDFFLSALESYAAAACS